MANLAIEFSNNNGMLELFDLYYISGVEIIRGDKQNPHSTSTIIVKDRKKDAPLLTFESPVNHAEKDYEKLKDAIVNGRPGLVQLSSLAQPISPEEETPDSNETSETEAKSKEFDEQIFLERFLCSQEIMALSLYRISVKDSDEVVVKHECESSRIGEKLALIMGEE